MTAVNRYYGILLLNICAWPLTGRALDLYTEGCRFKFLTRHVLSGRASGVKGICSAVATPKNRNMLKALCVMHIFDL